jgi:hypothetical protein
MQMPIPYAVSAAETQRQLEGLLSAEGWAVVDGVAYKDGYQSFSLVTGKEFLVDPRLCPPGLQMRDDTCEARRPHFLDSGGEANTATISALGHTLQPQDGESLFGIAADLRRLYSSDLLGGAPGTLGDMLVADLGCKVLEHVFTWCLVSTDQPVNALHWLDAFQHPIITYRHVAQEDVNGPSTAYDVQKYISCMRPKLVEDDKCGAAGFKGVYADGSGAVLHLHLNAKYRSIFLGRDSSGAPVIVPLHCLILILCIGPWVLVTNREELSAAEPDLYPPVGEPFENVPRPECMHKNSCQSSTGAHCCSLWCLLYGSRQRNVEMALEYAQSMGGRIQGLSTRFQCTGRVGAAERVANKKGEHLHTEWRSAWLAQQLALKHARKARAAQLLSAAAAE